MTPDRVPPEADAKRSIPGDGFFRSRWVEPPAGVEELEPALLAPGFRAGAAHCGLKGGGKTDVCLITCDAEAVSSAILLTRNASAAAPVRVCRERVDRGAIRAAVVNAGNANAETGERGLADAWAMCGRAAEELGLAAEQVAVAETGMIGVPLPIDAVLGGIGEAAGRLAADGGDAFAEAIMTTDRWTKSCTVRAGGVTLSAQAKGAGMMQPDFATMLCFVQTDAIVDDPDATLRAAVESSFERVTVDGQTSTNDTILLQATGASGAPLPEGLLEAVLLQLAIEIVADGEGAARVARIAVEGAASTPRPSGWPGRSPTRRWSRPRSTGATRTGAGSRRPPAWRSPARTSTRSAPTRSTPPSSARRRRRRRSGCGSTAATARPRSGSPISATST